MKTFDSYDACKKAGPELMAALVDRTSSTARFATVQSLNQVLTETLNFRVVSNMEFGPAGGRQIFFQNGRVVVRVKTKGDARGPRAEKPHLSVGITDGKGLDWTNDLCKLTAEGKVAAKSFTSADRFKPDDHQGNPQRFVLIGGPEDDDARMDAWANRTHFNF